MARIAVLHPEAMTRWSNWSGRHEVDVESLRFVRTEPELAGLIARATRAGRCVRVAGAGHSHQPLVPTCDLIVDLSALSGVISVDVARSSARVRAGTPIYALGPALHSAGLALANQGDIDRQFIGGAVATGTHGTGRTLSNLSAAVVGARVIVASGDAIECSSASEADLFEAVRLNLGAVGVVTELDLQLRPAYRLAERGWTALYDEVRPEVDALTDGHRHFEFFWYPRRDTAVAKVIDETDDEPRYPLGEEGGRLGWSFEVLPNHRPELHTEMEFSVPIGRSLECLDDLRALVRRDFPGLRWPIEYRTLAADDVWLSTAYHRDVATISVHQGIDEVDEPLFRACETVFRRYEGRPHWGKVNYFEAADFATSIPQWRRWWTVRNRVDQAGTFLNDYLRSLSA